MIAIRSSLIFPVLFLCAGVTASAQNQYISVFDYQTPALSPVANIPGVSWVSIDNSAYDVNHQRFFFQGSVSTQGPWQLFVIDAPTGAVLASPLIANNISRPSVFGLQYDKSVDTLYAIVQDANSGNISFAWVNPSTGVVNLKKTIAGFGGYSGSTYDVADHLYLYYGGSQLVGIDARTGDPVSVANFSAMTTILDLVYDNTNSTLYGISIVFGTASFVMINPATGAIQNLSTLPVNSFPTIDAFTIDEAAGHFIFTATLPTATSCIDYELYSIDMGSGMIVESNLYPYAQDPSNPLDSNLVEFSFDNQRGRLYALNWRPTIGTIPPLITIAAAADPVCPGEPDVFTATLSAPQVTNTYQWLVNSRDVGGNTSVYTYASPADGDSIRCILQATTACGTTLIDTSGPVVLAVHDTGYVAIRISAMPDTACAGMPILFNATITNGGASPGIQWLVDGIPAGTGGQQFTSSTLTGGQLVNCIVTTGATCIYPAPVTSNSLQPVIQPLNYASLGITASTATICAGDTVIFQAAPVNGGSAPSLQWLIDGLPANGGGTNGDLFNFAALADGDTVSCILQSSIPCSSPTLSGNEIVMTVRTVPVLTMPADTMINRGQEIRLSPTVQGVIGSYQWLPAAGLDDPTIPDPGASPLYTTSYGLYVTGADGCTASGKVTVQVFTPLYMPDAFTPNGDGRNDVFRIPPSVSIELSRFCVFDRWGQRVFATGNSAEGWNGTIGGRAVPAGAYVWMVEYTDPFTRQRLVKSGTVLLLR